MSEQKYTQPQLRQQIKDELMHSDKGGKPGQWSARKSQLLVQEYEKQGGGYQGEKDEAAKSLEAWTQQDWQTQSGDAKARKDGKTKRYLPKAVWNRLSESEKQEVEQCKQKQSQNGQQYVEWTPAVKRAMAEIEQDEDSLADLTQAELYDLARDRDISGRSNMNKNELISALGQSSAS
ncbi:MAG: Rho termination factor N-terminal domain-containing protein [Spirulinaceae cyanobacterium]